MMATPRSSGPSTPRRTFGATETTLETNNITPETPTPSDNRGRFSFSQNQAEPSFIARWRKRYEEEVGSASPDLPSIPSALEQKGESNSTPLPVLSMIVLSITMLGEFLSANVSTPFLLFMVRGFDKDADDADVASKTGLLVASFFLTQFITSLLWATVANKHGQRIVLFTSLLGSAITCVMFGTSTTMAEAVVVRFMQGVFAGAVGVARGTVTVVTDPSNEGRAYAILGFCWGFGGVAGAIIGGTFESPAQKWPTAFENFPIFVKYPYLLPTAMASTITLTGSLLSLFLARDGGPREGAVRLPDDKMESQNPTIPEEDPPSSDPFGDDAASPHGVVQSLRQKVSGYFAQRVYDASEGSSPQDLPMASSAPKPRAFSRTSRADAGSAYGYTGDSRQRLASTATTLAARRGSNASSMRRRRGSNINGPQPAVDTADLNFAQRLLMANENAVVNMADLWVAAAINVDNENPFESDSEVGDFGETFESDDEGSTLPASRSTRFSSRAPSNALRPPLQQRTSSGSYVGRSRLSSFQSPGTPPIHHTDGMPSSRRVPNAVPAIFAHPGVRTPTAVIDAQQLLTRSDDPEVSAGGGLAPIFEGRRETSSEGSAADSMMLEKSPSLASQLPVLIIVQYGLLALHSTTHDQLFLSYLVSDYEAGGLNLNAGHFAQLIALMCLAQIVYQFYLYPNIGPPRGRFSHLAMFRLGSALFIPAYLTVTLYRVFASPTEDGNFFLMTMLSLSTAVRYCGNTFAYTAVSILLNYMTPPHAISFANGVAQSIVSLARCLGPILGGYLWAVSTQDNPGGYPIGFLVVSAVAMAAIAQSFVIR